MDILRKSEKCNAQKASNHHLNVKQENRYEPTEMEMTLYQNVEKRYLQIFYEVLPKCSVH